MISFGVFEVDLEARELLKRGARLRLSDQAFRLLAVLLEDAGRLVTRAAIQERLWAKGTFVNFDTATNKAVSQLRSALGDQAGNPRFIETVSKRGYRFIGSVSNRSELGKSREPISSVVVLPFENLTGSADKRFLAEGVSEVLITRLGSLSDLRLISRTSALACLDGSRDLASIGRDLGVDFAIEGSVMCSEATMRITVRLVKISGVELLWQGNYDRDIRSLFELFDEVHGNLRRGAAAAPRGAKIR